MKKLLLGICIVASVGWGEVAKGEIILDYSRHPEYKSLVAKACTLYKENEYSEVEIKDILHTNLLRKKMDNPFMTLSMAIEIDSQLVLESYTDIFLVYEQGKDIWKERQKCDL